MMNRVPNDIPVSLEGWLSYQLVSAAGVVVQDGEQHNLILNSGLDAMAAVGIRGAMNYAVVGTGSTPPDVSQTALGAEVARTNAIGSTYPQTVRVSPGVYRYVLEREFDFGAANGNLTEWGLSPGGAGGVLSVRELFRDGNGNPVVITKDNTQKLRLTYTLQINLSPVVRTSGAVEIAGLGVRTGSYTLCGVGDFAGDLQVIEGIMRAAAPGGMFGQGGSGLGVVADPGYRAADYNLWRISESYTGPVANSAGAYVPGSFSRAGQLYQFDTSAGNGVLVAVTIAVNTDYYNRTGYVWTFDPGQEITKTDRDRLELRGPAVTWGRA